MASGVQRRPHALPPPPFFAVHNAPTPLQSPHKAALAPLHVAFTPLHAASHSPHAPLTVSSGVQRLEGGVRAV